QNIPELAAWLVEAWLGFRTAASPLFRCCCPRYLSARLRARQTRSRFQAATRRRSQIRSLLRGISTEPVRRLGRVHFTMRLIKRLTFTRKNFEGDFRVDEVRRVLLNLGSRLQRRNPIM